MDCDYNRDEGKEKNFGIHLDCITIKQDPRQFLIYSRYSVFFEKETPKAYLHNRIESKIREQGYVHNYKL